MRVLILGANGRTGRLISEYALSEGHVITALVRKSSSLQQQDGLTVVEGTPINTNDIESAFEATPEEPIQAVIVALSASRASDNPWAKPTSPPFFVRDCVRNVTSVMKSHKVRRIIIMSAFGAGRSWTQLSIVVKLLFQSSNMILQIDDHNAVDQGVRSDPDLDWTFARPTMLKEAKGTGALVTKNPAVRGFGEDGQGIGMFDGCTRESVAKWIVDSLQDDMTLGKAVCLAN